MRTVHDLAGETLSLRAGLSRRGKEGKCQNHEMSRNKVRVV